MTPPSPPLYHAASVDQEMATRPAQAAVFAGLFDFDAADANTNAAGGNRQEEDDEEGERQGGGRQECVVQ